MNLPGRVNTIINELYNRNTVLAKGSDDDRRALTMKIVQQICYEFGPKWGTKRADPGRPPSKDSIAYLDGSTLWSYDWQNGSTRAPHVPMGRLIDITGQVFIPVTPTNHLKDENKPPVVPPVTPGVPPVNPPTPTTNMSEVLAKLANIERQNEILVEYLTRILTTPVPVYEARIFGQSVTFTPRGR